MELIEKEVYFHQYCQTCKHREKSEGEDPCWDCLDQPWNEHSHKPINWKPAKGFEADVQRPEKYFIIAGDENENEMNTIVRCAKRNLCKQLTRYHADGDRSENDHAD